MPASRRAGAKFSKTSATDISLVLRLDKFCLVGAVFLPKRSDIFIIFFHFIMYVLKRFHDRFEASVYLAIRRFYADADSGLDVLQAVVCKLCEARGPGEREEVEPHE